MDRDVESRLERLCLKYLQAQSEVDLMRPTNLPTGRSRRKAGHQVADIIGSLRADRYADTQALVKLAYVRGMRTVNPTARLGELELREVDFLQRRLDRDLRGLEIQEFHSFKEDIRRLKVAQTLEEYSYPDATVAALTSPRQSFPLEQHARASIRTIVDTAMRAGASTASATEQYDGDDHADR